MFCMFIHAYHKLILPSRPLRFLMVYRVQCALKLGSNLTFSPHRSLSTFWTVVVYCQFLTPENDKNKFTMNGGVFTLSALLVLSRFPFDWSIYHSHWTGCFSAVCFIMWLAKYAFWVKDLSQTLHLYLFSPVCVLIWIFRSAFKEKHLPHSSHLHGFSPVCLIIWVVRFPFRPKHLPHSGQGYGFSPVWVLICSASFSFRLKLFPQSLHW